MVAEPHELALTIRITLSAVLRGEPEEVVGRRSGTHVLPAIVVDVDTEIRLYPRVAHICLTIVTPRM